MVEHEEEFIRAADQLIEIGPGAGDRGGEVVFQGSLAEMLEPGASLTGDFLAARRGVSIPQHRRQTNRGRLKLIGARGNNLQNLTVEFPLNLLCVVTGVSGAGKTSLVHETLYGALCRRKGKKCDEPLAYDDVVGAGQIDDVILVDQTPIGRSARSNPVTYIKAFDAIRQVFAETIEARTRNYTASHFSFNVEGGRCSVCEGEGFQQIDMQFMPDVFLPCRECGGTRYRKEILAVKYRGKSIADVLSMTAREAFAFFRGQTKVQARLKQLIDVGLEYLQLGHPANTLSAGEAQRLKLAAHLSEAARSRTLFLLDEPTTGLHFADVVTLLDCFEALLSVGHSLIVVEHNLQLMRAADYLIDLGPEAGEAGGEVVVTGAPEEVALCARSHTGRFLAASLLAVSGER
jgi:excinuclease ABC subunit A